MRKSASDLYRGQRWRSRGGVFETSANKLSATAEQLSLDFKRVMQHYKVPDDAVHTAWIAAVAHMGAASRCYRAIVVSLDK